MGGPKMCVIHTVGPQFGSTAADKANAEQVLTLTYTNVFRRWMENPHPQPGGTFTTLRLLPISGGIFAGAFMSQMPRITRDAVVKALSEPIFGHTYAEEFVRRQQHVLLCIYKDPTAPSLSEYQSAFFPE